MKKSLLFLFLSLVMTGLGSAQSQSSAGDYDGYGTKVGIGITILDGLGMPVRYYISPKQVLEGGLYLAGISGTKTVNNTISLEINGGLALGAGFTFFGDRFEKSKKNKVKIRANGVALRAGYLFGDYPTFMPSLGWAQETFRKDRTNRSFIFELGIKGFAHQFDYNKSIYGYSNAGIYLRCHWNFFL